MTTTRHPGFPERPLLRPGVRVTRRSSGELQVGLDRSLALVAPDSAPVRELLEGLRHGVAPSSPAALAPGLARLCETLLERGLVVDGDAWLESLAGRCDDERTGLTAVVAEAGPVSAAVLRRRRRTPVTVVAAGLDAAEERCRRLLSGAGLEVDRRGEGVVLHLSLGEPERDLVDDWARHDRPHAFLVVSEGRVRVGPFVVPGQTACLRCLDAHAAELDPRHPLVLQQYAEARGPRDGLPEPVPHDLVDLAVGFLVRDVTTWVDGGAPATWSTTVDVDPALVLARTPWPVHPWCGCCWGPSAAVAG